MNNNVFLQSVLAEIPRLLGQINRNPVSASYGSCDRAYWLYRTNDISCCRYQEAAYTLALLYHHSFSGNVYYHDQDVLEWINAILQFSATIQRSDGSFDEWYLHEGSYVGTSFVTTALTQTVTLLGEENITQYQDILKMLDRAAGWIMKHDETRVLNQVAGSIVALESVSLLTNKKDYKEKAKEKLLYLLHEQSSEGWWREYGGPDIGYLSLTVDYLSRLRFMDMKEKTMMALERTASFIVNFLYPDFTTGGEHFSRNTEYLIPSGFVRLADTSKSMRLLSIFCAAALKKETGIQPKNLDDRYLCYILYNWLEAGLGFTTEDYEQEIEHHLQNRQHDTFSPESGLRVVANNDLYFVSNFHKGGAFRLYHKQSMYMDSGCFVSFGGVWFTSQTTHDSWKVERAGSSESIEGILERVREPLMKTPIMVVFKSVQLLLGRISMIQKFFKHHLRNFLIHKQHRQGNIFKRTFLFKQDKIVVTDQLKFRISPVFIRLGLRASHAFIPSSRYYTGKKEWQKLLQPEKTIEHSADGQPTITRIFYLNDNI